KEIAALGNIDEPSLIQYVIDGISDASSAKHILYGANSLRDFKEKLRSYEAIVARAISTSKPTYANANRRTTTAASESSTFTKPRLRCYSCGEVGHKSENCAFKVKGMKCFSCNQFGHKSSQCKGLMDVEVNVNQFSLQDQRSNMLKTVKIGSHDVTALLDTGSDVSVMKRSLHRK